MVSTPLKWDDKTWSTFLPGCHAHGDYLLYVQAAKWIPDDVLVSEYGVSMDIREPIEMEND